MAEFQDSQRPALSVEEAALLPALPRRAAGDAALRYALRAANRMDDKRLSNSVNGSIDAQRSVTASPPAYRDVKSRAALHHALRRRT